MPKKLMHIHVQPCTDVRMHARVPTHTHTHTHTHTLATSLAHAVERMPVHAVERMYNA